MKIVHKTGGAYSTYDHCVSHLTKEELSDPDHILEEKPFRLPFLTGSNIGYKRY